MSIGIGNSFGGGGFINGLKPTVKTESAGSIAKAATTGISHAPVSESSVDQLLTTLGVKSKKASPAVASFNNARLNGGGGTPDQLHSALAQLYMV